MSHVSMSKPYVRLSPPDYIVMTIIATTTNFRCNDDQMTDLQQKNLQLKDVDENVLKQIQKGQEKIPYRIEPKNEQIKDFCKSIYFIDSKSIIIIELLFNVYCCIVPILVIIIGIMSNVNNYLTVDILSEFKDSTLIDQPESNY
ncbi:hypothetical protein DERP_009881 [Dermatophagoides pteronyssinus]|uniref:Uncharacterized protein n=1 Tax=Dermatophagoides pteronyssinus TaxID=6956 RepID=A0ABQ8J1T9_DERPT|nr:hypothetical protein DERP_009881 [Dermatophagoides pteronyssinus]